MFTVFFDDDVPSGSAVLTLSGVDFAPIGASNRVLSNFVTESSEAGSNFNDVQIGTWEMVAPIPLPAAAWLLLGGVGALGAVARKRRAA